MFTEHKAGTLKNGRYGHGAIFDGEKFLIIGGMERYAPVKNEVCTLKGSKMTCVEKSVALKGYAFYPELFLVGNDFGKDMNRC